MDELKILRKTNNFLKRFGFAVGFYIVGLVGTNSISSFTSPTIQNQSQLEAVIRQESKKLGIFENIIINSRFGGEFTYLKKIDEGEYEMVLNKDFGSISDVRHELYHLADGHFDGGGMAESFPNFLKYLFWEEPQATIYALSSLKL